MPIHIPSTVVPATTTEPQTLVTPGAEKVGKSETIAKLPNSLHIDTQGGTAFISTRRVSVNSLADWKELCAILVPTWTKAPWRFLIIDVLNDVETWALEEAEATYRRMPVGRNFGGQSVLELDMGLGYGYLRDAFFRLIAPVWGCERWNTIFVVHTRPKFLSAVAPINPVLGVVSDELDLTGKVRQMMCRKVDAIGKWLKVADPKQPGGKLILDFRTTDTGNCACRARHLHGKVVAFSDPAKPEEWAAVWPSTWDKAPVVPAVATPAPAVAPKSAPTVAPAPTTPPTTPLAAPAAAAAPTATSAAAAAAKQSVKP